MGTPLRRRVGRHRHGDSYQPHLGHQNALAAERIAGTAVPQQLGVYKGRRARGWRKGTV